MQRNWNLALGSRRPTKAHPHHPIQDLLWAVELATGGGSKDIDSTEALAEGLAFGFGEICSAGEALKAVSPV